MQKKLAKNPVSLKYPEQIHLSTDYMVEGTDEEKFGIKKLQGMGKFLFTHGIREINMRYGNEILCIPGVHYAPEVTLNVLSESQLEAQGVELNYNNNRCRLSYMFKHPKACKFDEDKMKEKQNQYLEKYFDSIDPKGDYVLEKTTWDKAVKKDHTNTDFIRMEDKIYPVKDLFRAKFDDMVKWFYVEYLHKPVLGPIPYVINGIEIYLLDLYKLIDCLEGYLNVLFSRKFGKIAEMLGLPSEYGKEKATVMAEEGCDQAYVEDQQDKVGLKRKAQTEKESCGNTLRKLEHFGIKLEDSDDEGNKQQPGAKGTENVKLQKDYEDFKMKGLAAIEEGDQEDNTSTSKMTPEEFFRGAIKRMVGSIGEVEKGFHCILYAKIIKIHRKHGWAYLACKKFGNIAKQTDAEGINWWKCKLHGRITADGGSANPVVLHPFCLMVEEQLILGKISGKNDGHVVVEFPEEMLIPDSDDHVGSVIKEVYDDWEQNMFDPTYFQDRAILAPTHEQVDKVNNRMMAMLPGREKVCYSSDTVTDVDIDFNYSEALYTIEFLNSIRMSGIPHHKLVLKVGALAAMDQPAYPTRPRPDVPGNYGPVMNTQELERMRQLTVVSQDHRTRLDLYSQTIQDILNCLERIDQRVNRDQGVAFEARALNRRTWYLALSTVLVVLLLLVSRLVFGA
ncbi:ARID DNA-binding domain-containing protein [Tanacetum coccineum]